MPPTYEIRNGLVIGLGPEELRQRREELLAEARQLTDNAANGVLERDDLTRFDAITAEIDAVTETLKRHEQLRVAVDNGHVDKAWTAPNVTLRTGGKPWEVRDYADLDEIKGRASDSLAALGVADDAIARCDAIITAQEDTTERGALARRIVLAASPDYTRAFMKLVREPMTGSASWTHAETAAWQRTMSIGTNPDGGYMVPTHLDPTIILTNAGSTNAIRKLARTVTLTAGNVWHGVSSAGVSASWDGELVEVSDDTPALADPSVTCHKAQVFVPFSIEASEDIASLTTELARLFADGRERLEGTAFSTGSGTGEPNGIWTAVAANSGSRVVSTTAASIGVVDLHALYKAVPQRSRVGSSWLMNPTYSLAIKALGTAVSASYSGDLTSAPTGTLLGKQLVESDDAPSTQTTTALDSEIVLGDFSNYVIADKPGSMAVELVPHLLNTANNRPDGRRGLYAHWRTGGDVVNGDAFRVLCDRTSA